MLGLLSFVCGALSDISFSVVGEIFLTELALIPLAGLTLLVKGSGGAFRAPIFWGVVFAGLTSLAGYMISDLFAGTDPAQYLRGWGRMIVMISNCVCLMILVAHDKQNLWWFMLGAGIGGILFLATQGIGIQTWKLGYAERVSLVVLTCTPLLPVRLTALALAAFGLVNIALDYRSLGAAFIAIATVLWTRSGSNNKAAMSFAQYSKFVIIAAICLIGVIVALSLTDKDYHGRRQASNTGRSSAIVVALHAISDSPIIGLGSWTTSQKYADMLRKVSRENTDPDVPPVSPEYEGNGFQAHSQILQSWIEGGILGAVFFLFYGYHLFQAIRWYMLHRPLDFFSAAFTFIIITSLWSWMASPFLGFERIQIAMAMSAIATFTFDKSKRRRLRGTIPATILRTPATIIGPGPDTKQNKAYSLPQARRHKGDNQ